MDEKLSKALEFANYTQTLEDKKSQIKEKFYQTTLYFFAGGQFTVDQTLLSFVSLLLQKQNQAILIDDNENPIKIDDLKVFQDNILDVYFQATNEYFTDIQDIKRKRSIEKLVNYE